MTLQRHISRIALPEIACLPLFSAPRYRHRLYDNYYYTDLTREKLCERGAFWLIERIFALANNIDGVAGAKHALKNMFGNFVFNVLLHGPAHRTSTIFGVKAFLS